MLVIQDFVGHSKQIESLHETPTRSSLYQALSKMNSISVLDEKLPIKNREIQFPLIFQKIHEGKTQKIIK
jgi:hypothetical protein